MERWLPLIVILLAGVLLASDLNQGWVPHDEGALGQAAERVLAGQVPHRDFDDIYTGALAYLHAAFFSIGSHASTTLRIPLFLFALPWVAALYAIARRFVPPVGAALVAVTALVWSVPNYPASVPSWFNLFFATFGTLALLRGLETGRRRWMVLAGVAGGVSFLFKLSGVFYLLGGGIALIATSFRRKPDGVSAGRARSGAALVSVILILVLVLLAVPITRAGAERDGPFPVAPRRAVCRADLARVEVTVARPRSNAAARSFETLGPFVLGALLPVIVFLVFLLVDGRAFPDDRRRAREAVPADGFGHDAPAAADRADLFDRCLVCCWRCRRVVVSQRSLAIVAAAVFAAVVYCVGRRPQDLRHGRAWQPGGSRCSRRPALRGC